MIPARTTRKTAFNWCSPHRLQKLTAASAARRHHESRVQCPMFILQLESRTARMRTNPMFLEFGHHINETNMTPVLYIDTLTFRHVSHTLLPDTPTLRKFTPEHVLMHDRIWPPHKRN
ncbi:hypothetical protein J6590_001154 [Homalodisca vitripennis]|nr:hypothetical protein J6590_001154 [Homalodisca vitripennis]